ncbi:MAG: complex I subunit 5 family protein, partial [Verrucomicrobiia bacterium]
MTPEQAVIGAIFVCLVGAVLTGVVASSRRLAGWAAFFVTALSGALVLAAVARVFAGGASEEPARFLQIPALGFALRLHVDGLSAVFLVLSVLVAAPAALYSIRYMDHYSGYG